MNEKVEIDETLCEIQFNTRCHCYQLYGGIPATGYSLCGLVPYAEICNNKAKAIPNKEHPKSLYCQYCGNKRCEECYGRMQ